MNEGRRSPQEQGDEERAGHELADYTDALLEGRLDPAGEPPPLADQVALLARALKPQPPPERLRRTVQQAVRAAWDGAPAPSRSLRACLTDLLGARRRPWVWAACASLLAIALAALLLVGPEGPGAIGTAAGDGGGLIVLIVLGLAGTATLIAWLLRRRP